MRLVSTKQLFLTTRNRNEGSIHDATYKLPPGSLTCGDGEVFRVCLTRLAFFNDIYNVNESNNVVSFRKLSTNVTTDVILAPGNYPYTSAAITLGAAVTAQYPNVSITFNNATNKLTFTFKEPHELIFPSAMWGFCDGSTRATVNDAITSQIPAKGRVYDRLYVKLKGVNPISFSYDNLLQDELRLSNGLAAITISSPPYTWFNYVNQSAEEMCMYIANKDMHKLRIEILDGTTGLPASFLTSELDLILRVDVFNNQPDASGDKMDKMVDYLRMMFMMNGLSQPAMQGEEPPAPENVSG
jgi:hypothetical protein